MAIKNDLLDRTRKFALDSLLFYRTLPKTQDAQIPALQFYRAATSISANYRASQRARSRAEFISKLGSVVEEADESVYWLEFLRDGNLASNAALLSEAKELCAILTAALRTARRHPGPHP